MRSILLCLSLFYFSQVFGQFESRYWILGKQLDSFPTILNLDFFPGDSLYPKSIPAQRGELPPRIQSSTYSSSSFYSTEGGAIATDYISGELLFYTNGDELFDAQHQQVNQGFSLGGNPASTQSVVICPQPAINGDPSYLIFVNPSASDTGGFSTGHLIYWKFTPQTGLLSGPDSLPGPHGLKDVGEGMTIIPHPYKEIYWLITRLRIPNFSNSTYPIYKIDSTGVSYANAYRLGPSVPTDSSLRTPQSSMAFQKKAPDSYYFAVSFARWPNFSFPNSIMITEFNPLLGELDLSSKQFEFGYQGVMYDVEFSPTGKFLYFSTSQPSTLWQLEWQRRTPRWTRLRNFGSVEGGGLKLGADGFIYFIEDGLSYGQEGSLSIGRILYPERSYLSLPRPKPYYQDSLILFEQVMGYNFPEFLPPLPKDTAIIVVDTADISTNTKNEISPGLYIQYQPNQFVVNFDEEFFLRRFRLVDLSGREILKEYPRRYVKKLKVNVHLDRGFYILSVEGLNEKIVRKLLLK